MLIALLGRPLTVELRAVPDVLKPGSDVSESSALRLDSGRLVIWVPVRFVEIDGDCVWTIVADSPMTVTLSSSAPTCRRHLHVGGHGRIQRHGIEHGRLEAHQRHGHRVGAARQGGHVEAAVVAAHDVDFGAGAVVLDLDRGAGNHQARRIGDRPRQRREKAALRVDVRAGHHGERSEDRYEPHSHLHPPWAVLQKINVTEGNDARTTRQLQKYRKRAVSTCGTSSWTLPWMHPAHRFKKGSLGCPRRRTADLRHCMFSGAISAASVRARRFDVAGHGSRRINGMRNFRQALASPHSALFSPIRRGPLRRPMTKSLPRVASPPRSLAFTSGCAMSLRSPNISDLKDHPGRYTDRTVSVNGVVTSSWGLPLVPFRFYKVDDGTGEVTVLSGSSRMPARGERVRVKGKVAGRRRARRPRGRIAPPRAGLVRQAVSLRSRSCVILSATAVMSSFGGVSPRNSRTAAKIASTMLARRQLTGVS